MSVIQLKRGTASAWTTYNPVLLAGEFGFETDTLKIKIGNGTDNWSALDYLPSSAADLGLENVDNTADADKPISTATQAALDDKEDVANKGQANGYASLDSGGKVPGSQLPNSIMEYQGTWNATTNSPTLADGTGSAGDVYRVTVAGSQNLGSGGISFSVGDYAIYNGSTWEKSDTTDSVATVNGYVGNVSLSASDIGLGNVDNTSDATKNSATATLTNKTLTNPTINAYTEGVAALGTVSSSATIAISAATVVTATLTASTACTFTMPTAAAGKSFTLMLKQAASTGNGTATFSGVKWGTTGAPTITAGAGKMDILTFFSDGTNWYGSAAQGFTP